MDKEKQDQLLNEIVMLLAIQVRRGVLQSTVIQEMSSVGFSPKRISELLNTSSNTVNVALHHARKNKKKKQL
jgi:DNA-directed RNA polymerase specialized sigma24 family protein